eukprot:CAMPEP_0168761004 /NCGR_PEP_ID=MMETSP0724-20121128/23070_1 /TAXON_ID=265536 /ORGANISM="Amphiprora sp., Strain CCMP467" /LENGTH=346 /DNA_ID=CAMNT_0008810055 /DNA_START=17 /DNA_END=1058 /DNA_ORIENTATION=-
MTTSNDESSSVGSIPMGSKDTQLSSLSGEATQQQQQQRGRGRRQESFNTTTPVAINTAAFKYQHTWSQRGGTRYCREPHDYALWSIVRHPTPRALSAFNYYRVGHANETATTTSIRRFFQKARHHQFVQLLLHRNTPSAGGGAPVRPAVLPRARDDKWVRRTLTRQILDPYHFIAVQERWAESLAVLQLLWDLREGDVMTAAGRSSNTIKAVGDWTHQWDNQQSCFFIPPKPSLDDAELSEWISREYSTTNNLDVLLHRIVNASLDLTIAELGRSRVEQVMQRQARLQTLIQRECRGKVTYPCSSTGQWQPEHQENCYKNDIWCGYPCLNDVVDRYETGEFDAIAS